MWSRVLPRAVRQGLARRSVVLPSTTVAKAACPSWSCSSFHSSAGSSNSSNSSNSSTYGIVFDVDGVLVRGRENIPGAAGVIDKLNDAAVPYLLMTNGGGVPEADKAAVLGEQLGVELQGEHMLLSHTPMAMLAEKYRDELVLLVGKKRIKDIAHAYGFRNVMTTKELHTLYPRAFPDIPPPNIEVQDRWRAPIKAVFTFLDPANYHRDLQFCLDVCRSDGIITNVVTDGSQPVNLYVSCPDLEYVNEFPVPRLGAGIFHICLEELFYRSTGRRLKLTLFGKPLPETYNFAEKMLQQQAEQAGYEGVDTIYAVGDNPVVDVKGANEAGSHWVSVLVRTGVYTDQGNHAEHPGDIVVDTVADALAAIEEREAGAGRG